MSVISFVTDSTSEDWVDNPTSLMGNSPCAVVRLGGKRDAHRVVGATAQSRSPFNPHHNPAMLS